MTLKYFKNGIPQLIEEYYQLSFSNGSIPFESTILPQGFTHITHLYFGDQKAIINENKTILKDTIISGQFSRSYHFKCNSEAMSFGMSFHPTALYKLLNTNISKLDNKHLNLKTFHPKFEKKISTIFNDFTTAEDMVNRLNTFFNSLDLTINKTTDTIDKVIQLIQNKEGLLNVSEILEEINLSQKTLETQFKKVVGLTPGKYIRLYRFIKLMKRYENQELEIKDLIYMFDYYDRSHFAKDFKLFMNESPSSYFKKDYPLLKAVFKN
ncbi:helix-turn-helix domain-containing protein [Psychroserpens sp.]|uniref:helix-turn-helix domain-containing protein n=1 Tax=Psychroserpens sp. TaxID=2020870 RepID=UPI001B27A272|nr:helix-turn-helix domain-containing protein [Psychroserpens sp.]MBO6607036.1 AraC family transcriptional regulator [Psychroserpens sp.]MBO6631766.1 AraC family transcriptional regulator [Psychroserpens sp.]MBO6654182.1 AraC family transcriptional regulator [Psychroserpens sp.]MBO6682532.1 AraC family transcriptional regulator [Psychroserpens sp.]MBO6750808.1 AraC family transcriptional regulator [Psychroserpens sp.]